MSFPVKTCPACYAVGHAAAAHCLHCGHKFPRRTRPSLAEAVEWMAYNDDTEWVANGDPISVTGAMVADLFGVGHDELIEALRKAIKKARKGD